MSRTERRRQERAAGRHARRHEAEAVRLLRRSDALLNESQGWWDRLDQARRLFPDAPDPYRAVAALAEGAFAEARAATTEAQRAIAASHRLRFVRCPCAACVSAAGGGS